MDHAYVNRFSLAALGSVLFVMLLVAFSNLVISTQNPRVPGYALPTSGAATAPAAEKAAPEEPLPALLAKADAKKGEQDAKACATCHNFQNGGGAKIGPGLWDVVGRKIASVAGFACSDSLKGMSGDWSYEELNKWIADPKAMASGTKMTFPGEKDPHKRADTLVHLQTLSDKPVPFPK